MESTIKYAAISLILFSLNAYSDDSADPSNLNPTFNAKGKGVMSDSLTKKPADLTVLSKNNNGHFPFTEVYQAIEGSQQIDTHGTRDMPIWGDRYRKEAYRFNEEAKKYFNNADKYKIDEYLHARGLILELVTYIMSIQEE